MFHPTLAKRLAGKKNQLNGVTLVTWTPVRGFSLLQKVFYKARGDLIFSVPLY